MKDRVDAILDRAQAVYLESILAPRDALLVRMEEFAADNGQPIADPEVAQMMRILVRTKQPRRIMHEHRVLRHRDGARSGRGNLDAIIDPLTSHFQAEKLREAVEAK